MLISICAATADRASVPRLIGTGSWGAVDAVLGRPLILAWAMPGMRGMRVGLTTGVVNRDSAALGPEAAVLFVSTNPSAALSLFTTPVVSPTRIHRIPGVAHASVIGLPGTASTTSQLPVVVRPGSGATTGVMTRRTIMVSQLCSGLPSLPLLKIYFNNN